MLILKRDRVVILDGARIGRYRPTGLDRWMFECDSDGRTIKSYSLGDLRKAISDEFTPQVPAPEDVR